MKRYRIGLIVCLLAPSAVFAAWGSIQDYRTFDKIDPGNTITWSATPITFTSLNTRNVKSYVIKNYGAGYFSGDLAHRFKLNLTASGNQALVYPWALTNSIADLGTIDTANGDFQCVNTYTNGTTHYIRLSICENGTLRSTGLSYTVSLSTDYYITVERDDDAGANSTGQLTCRVYTGNYYGESGASEVHTFTLDCAAGEQNDFQYLNALTTYYTGTTVTASGTVANLDIGEDADAFADVEGDWGTLETFTGYTEVDPGSDISVAANTITCVDLDTRATDSYVYKDFGVDHFSGDLIHRVKINITSMATNALLHMWLLTNDVDDVYGLETGGKDAQGVCAYETGGKYYLLVRMIANGVNQQADFIQISLATDYYLSVERKDTEGLYGTGRIILYICTVNYHGEAGSVELAATMKSCSAGEQNDFRYLFAANTLNTGPVTLCSMTIADMDVGEGTPPAGGSGQVVFILEDE